MNSRERNIEKMTSNLCDDLSFTSDAHVGVTSVDAKTTARRLYDAGYRKRNVSVGDENTHPAEKVDVIRCKDCAY